MQSRRITIAVCIALVGMAALAPASAASTDDLAHRTDVGPDGVGVAAQSGNGTDRNGTDRNGTAQPTGTARIYESLFTVNRGGVATVRVALENTTEATVVLGGEDAGYNVTVTVTDGNGDGVVPLLFHTGPVGMDGTRFVTVNDADDYGTLSAAPDPDATMSPGDYPIDVYAGHGVAGEPTSVVTLAVTESPAPPNASIGYDGDAVTLHPTGEQTVSGTTELEAGRNVTVRLRSSGETPFLKSTQATVAEDGSFEATFDLRSVEAPANGTVSVSAGGETLAGPVDAEVVAQEATSTPGMPGFGIGAALTGLAVVALLATRFGR